MTWPATDLRAERTWYWPNGIPESATLRVETTRRTAYFGVAPNGVRMRLETSTPQTNVAYAPGQSIPPATNVPLLNRYARGSVVQISFVLDDAHGHRFIRALVGDEVAPDAPPLRLDDLPEDLRDAIRRADETIRRAPSQG